MKRWETAMPWLMAGFFALIVGTCAVLRVSRGGCGVSDLAIFHSALLNAFNGHFYFTSLHPKGTLLYQHFDPIVFVLLPFYGLLGKAAWPVLPISQALAVALVFPAAARLGRVEGLGPRACLIVPALLLLNPAMHNIVWYDFHPFVFALPLLLWGWVWMVEGRLAAGSVCWGAAMLCKENVPLTVAMLGLALAMRDRRHRKAGLLWLAVGTAAFLIVTTLVMPAFRTVGEGNPYLVRYGWLGESVGGIVRTLATRPFWVIGEVFGKPESGLFLLKMLLPLGLLSLLRPRVLVAAGPELAILLLSSFVAMQSLNFHYPAVLLGVLIIAAVGGLGRLRAWAGPASGQRRKGALVLSRAATALGLIASTTILWTDGRTLPFLRPVLRRHYYERETRRAEIEALAAMIPPEAALSLPLNLLNPTYPFVERTWIAFAPDRCDLADYVIFDLKTRYYGGHKEPGLDEAVRRFRNSAEHTLIFEEAGFVAFRRNRRPVDDPDAFLRQWIEEGSAG
jgi:uncharacterized membrane protein